MKIYCVFDRYSVEHGEPEINNINEIFFNREECEMYVNELNEKMGGGIDYTEIDVNIHTGTSTIVEHMTDEDKYATEVSYGENNKILPPKNYLIGNMIYNKDSIIVEFVKK